MKKYLLMAGLAIVLSVLGSGEAHADRAGYEIGKTTISFTNVICSTGTASNIKASLPADFGAKTLVGVLVQNASETFSQYIGHTSSVSPTESSPNRGAKLKPGGNWPIEISELVNLFCIAEDAAAGVDQFITIVWFGV